MELFLHIGQEKTATTSIQSFFATNRDYFSTSHNLLYPTSPGNPNHIGTAIYFGTNPRLDELRKANNLFQSEKYMAFRNRFPVEFEHEIKGYDKVVISNEHCSSRLVLESEIRTLKSFFSAYFTKITIILYLRNQADMITSSYSTSIKSGSPHDLQTFYESHKNNLNYYKLVKLWADVFDSENIVVRPYDKTKWKNQNIIDDFLSLIGFNPEEISAKRTNDLNKSLDAAQLEFLRVYNNLVPMYLNGSINPYREGILPPLEANSEAFKVLIPENIAKDIETSFGEFNKKLIAEFLPSKPEYFSKVFATKPSEKLEQKQKNTQEDTTEMVKIASQIIMQKQDEIMRLRKILRENNINHST